MLAANYVDRYLSVVSTPKSSLQLLGTACLLIASKLREAVPFTADKLVVYTDHSVTVQQLVVCQSLSLSSKLLYIIPVYLYPFVRMFSLIEFFCAWFCAAVMAQERYLFIYLFYLRKQQS